MFDGNQESFVALAKVFAEKTRQIVFWVGAGLSKPAQLPDWDDLRRRMLGQAEQLLNQIDYSEDDHRHKKALIDVAKTERNFWKSFTHIKEVMGESTYAESIRSIFRPAERCCIPENYIRILDVRPTGVITTNIDQLMGRAFTENASQLGLPSVHSDFCGEECGSFLHLLSGGKFFILNLHGKLDNRNSWIFTKEEWAKLEGNADYKNFLGDCFLSKCIVFLGATVNDHSIIAHLDRVRGVSAANCQPLFWITSDTSTQTRVFCEKYNILPIYYPDCNDHAEIGAIFQKLKNSTSKDELIERPVIPEERLSGQSVRNFDTIDFSKLPLNELRTVLNRRAQTILAPNDADSYERYEKFVKEYERHIHNSWYVSDRDPDGSRVLTFLITKEIADGAFARVFEAKDETNNTVALKLLKEDVMRKEGWLQTFRRGIKAMHILGEHKVIGMVRYITASEIPAFVVMEFIHGITLKEAVENQQFKDWKDVLRVSCEISNIVRHAHGLPERVLHRDLRPPNIMLKGFDYDSEDWSVCVLDFDLAFHKGANEVSIQPTGVANGFLAPEQIEKQSKFTTRSALVDSYGMAMLLYYIVTGESPHPEQCKHHDWKDILFKNVAGKRCERWLSLPCQLARLIEQSTRYEQAQRLDMTQIYGRLNALQKAYADPYTVSDGDMLAEELSMRIASKLSFPVTPTIWNQDKAEAVITKVNGEKIVIRTVEKVIEIFIEWTKHSDVRNAISGNVTSAKRKFTDHGFNSVGVSIEKKGANVSIRVPNLKVCREIDKLANLIFSVKIAPKAY